MGGRESVGEQGKGEERNERNERKIPNTALRTLQHGGGGEFQRRMYNIVRHCAITTD